MSTDNLSIFDKVPPPIMRQTDPRLVFVNAPFFSLLSQYTHSKDPDIFSELDRRIRFVIETQTYKISNLFSTSDRKPQLALQLNNINEAIQAYNSVDLDINELVHIVAANVVN